MCFGAVSRQDSRPAHHLTGNQGSGTHVLVDTAIMAYSRKGLWGLLGEGLLSKYVTGRE